MHFLSIVILAIIFRIYTLTVVMADNSSISHSANSVVLEIQVTASNDDAEEQADGKVFLESSSLELTYDESSQIIGQRFTEVNIPQGTFITNAYIQFTAKERSSSSESLLILQAQDTANALPFLRQDNNISSRPTTKTTISWSPEHWLTKDDARLAQRTPNIAPMIQEVIDRPDWSAGNALLVLITGEGKRVAKSFDSDPNSAPVLHIEYDKSVQINDFIASQTIVEPNQPIVFSWLVPQLAGVTLGCELDVDGDDVTDYTITDCETTTSQKHVYKVAGYYTAKLTATNSLNISVNKTQAITIAYPTSVTIAAVGDIACDPTSEYFNYTKSVDRYCPMEALANSIKKTSPTAFLPLGDNQYEDGALWKFEKSYDLYFGQFKKITYPVVGNHEYITPNAMGYFEYFGAAAGDSSKGYYSYNLGNWHLIALNSNCLQIGGCQAGSQQEKWLRRDLAKNSTACTLAYWHHPRFSSGMHKNDTSYVDFWSALYDAQAEIVLVGHDHHYERFAPVNSNGDLDESLGIREFVVGSGGKSHTGFTKIQPNSEVRNKEDYGFLKLDLHSQSYDWQFISEDEVVLDSGSDSCHF